MMDDITHIGFGLISFLILWTAAALWHEQIDFAIGLTVISVMLSGFILIREFSIR